MVFLSINNIDNIGIMIILSKFNSIPSIDIQTLPVKEIDNR